MCNNLELIITCIKIYVFIIDNLIDNRYINSLVF